MLFPEFPRFSTRGILTGQGRKFKLNLLINDHIAFRFLVFGLVNVSATHTTAFNGRNLTGINLYTGQTGDELIQ